MVETGGAPTDLYAAGSGLSVTITLGPVTGSVTGGSFTYNPSAVTDWAFAGITGAQQPAYLNVHGGDTNLGVAGLGSIHVTSFDITKKTVALSDSNVPPAAGSLFTFTLNGFQVELGSGAASLTVGGSSLTVAEFVQTGGATTDLYAAGSGLSVTITLGPVTGSVTGGSFTYNPSAVTDWAFAGITGAQETAYLNVHGGDTNLGVAGLGSIHVTSFDITKKTVALSDSNVPPAAGSLFTFTLNGFQVELGSGAASLTVGGSSLTVAEFVQTGGATTDLYAAGSGLSVTITLGPVTGSVTGGSFTYNPSAVTDWAFAGITGAQETAYLNVHGGDTNLGVAGLGSIHVTSFDITKKTVALSDSNVPPAAGSLFTFTLNGFQVELGSGAASLTVGGSSLTVAEFVQTGGATTDLYAAGSGLSVTITLGPVTGSVTGGSFTYNPSAVTDWAFAGITGAQETAYLNVHGGDTNLGVAGLGSIHVTSFDITKKTVALSDSNVPPAAGSLFTFTLNGFQVELGSGAASLTVGGSSLTVAEFVQTGGATTDLYAAGSGLSVTITLGPVTGSVTGGSFTYNPSAVTDWAFAGITGAQQPAYLNVHGGDTNLGVAGLGSIHVTSFDITKKTVALSDSNVPPAAGSLFTFTLSGFQVELGSGAASLTVGGSSLTVAEFVQTGGATTDLYAAGSGLSVTITLGPVTGSVTGCLFTYSPSAVPHSSPTRRSSDLQPAYLNVHGGDTNLGVAGLG